MNHNKSKIVFLIACFCLLAGLCTQSSYSKARNSSKKVKAKTEFSEEEKQYAKCLQEKNITMYGTSWCPHCKEQKAVFGDLFQLVNYVDCDENAGVCKQKKITGYPTWLLPDGKEIDPGTISDVAKASGCTLAKNTLETKEVTTESSKEPSEKVNSVE
jgi:glutaredoxin